MMQWHLNCIAGLACSYFGVLLIFQEMLAAQGRVVFIFKQLGQFNHNFADTFVISSYKRLTWFKINITPEASLTLLISAVC